MDRSGFTHNRMVTCWIRIRQKKKMNPSSIKNKGRRFEKFITKQIEGAGLGKACRTPGSGSGQNKGDVFSGLDFMIEAKNEAQTNFLPNVDQAVKEAEEGNTYKDKWSLVTRDPRYPEFERVYVTMDFYEWLELLKKSKEPLIKEPDRDMRYKLQRLIQTAKDVIKGLEE